LLEGIARERLDRDRDILHVLNTALRRYDDFLNPFGGCRRVTTCGVNGLCRRGHA
jgi:hypothetical protein